MRFTHIIALFVLIVVDFVSSRGLAAAAPEGMTWNPQKQGSFVTALAADGPGNIWVGVEDRGVWRYTARNQKWTQFTTKDGLGDDNAYALAVDQRGRVWAGHLYHGVSVFNGAKWKNYGTLDGPLGERVFAIAVSPRDGDVWIATNAGLTRYGVKEDTWRSYTRANGMKSQQVTALAFDAQGSLYAGTACDGLLLSSAADDYQTWRNVRGPERVPNAPLGTGLPGNLINDVLVTRDNLICVATTSGLARSGDGGKTWTYLRGADWEQRVKGLYKGPAPIKTQVWGDLLREDYVTRLAQDAAGRLIVGYRRQGWEVRDPRSDKRLQEGKSDYVFALLPTAEALLIGTYGSGLNRIVEFGTRNAESSRSPITGTSPAPVAQSVSPTPQPALPSPAKPPTLAELNAMLKT
ncbi:MAG: hypothetical protein M3347_02295, partial [Armatimonadota bacterium]|nr:hypothetical protein [Armatimonadota bacterium]